MLLSHPWPLLLSSTESVQEGRWFQQEVRRTVAVSISLITILKPRPLTTDILPHATPSK